MIYQVDPEFSEEARKAKFMGIVTVNLWVDEHGQSDSMCTCCAAWAWGWMRRRSRR